MLFNNLPHQRRQKLFFSRLTGTERPRREFCNPKWYVAFRFAAAAISATCTEPIRIGTHIRWPCAAKSR